MKNDLSSKDFQRRVKRAYAKLACVAFTMMMTVAPAFAAGTTGGDALSAVSNLSR